MTTKATTTHIAAIALMSEMGKLSAQEAMELRMYAVTLELIEAEGGIGLMRHRLACLFDNCCEAVRNKKGRKSRKVIELIKELDIA
jgi:hypothetical protein